MFRIFSSSLIYAAFGTCRLLFPQAKSSLHVLSGKHHLRDFSIDAPEHENSLPNPGKLVILTLFLSQYSGLK
ncbi:Uncharacterised protein [Kingella denitrificans]|nr:Uncharacterised protein [Kingella denitrificans]